MFKIFKNSDSDDLMYASNNLIIFYLILSFNFNVKFIN